MRNGRDLPSEFTIPGFRPPRRPVLAVITATLIALIGGAFAVPNSSEALPPPGGGSTDCPPGYHLVTSGECVPNAPAPTRNVARDGGFEYPGAWKPFPGTTTNYVTYVTGQVAGESARSGARYMATNTATDGGGIYQDITGLSINPGDTFCASAWVRSQYPSTGAAVRYTIWLLGGAKSENGEVTATGLSNGRNWRQIQTCAEATTTHSTIRVQFYPTPNASGTLEIDDVDVH